MPYFYQHSEGAIIEKPKNVVESGGGPHEYFTGPFVRDWWFESDLLRPTRHPAPPQWGDEPDLTTGWARAEQATLQFFPTDPQLTPRMMIMVDQMEDTGRSPNAVGARRGFELISAHIEYLERENLRLSELLTTYYVNALRGDGDSLATFIKNYGHDVHRDRKTLVDAINEFQAIPKGDTQ